MKSSRRLPQAIRVFAIPLIGILLASSAEAAVCLFEKSLFRSLQRHAGLSDDGRLTNISRVEPITIPATKLRGFILHASLTPAPRVLLFAQGDATLADEMLAALTKFQTAGYDVFVFDYRGFGRSEGQPSIEMIERDYETIISYIRQHHSGSRFYYGISGGGIILLRALRKDREFAGLALDSTPSRLPFFCDSDFYPINNVPANAHNILVIQANQDTNVPPSDSERLAALVHSRGGSRSLINAGHPAPDMQQELAMRFDVVLRHFN